VSSAATAGGVFAVGQECSLFQVDELKLVVAGINSTMALTHRPQDDVGQIGAAQADWFAERLAAYERRGWLRLGAIHHGHDSLPTTDGHAPATGGPPAAGRHSDLFGRLNLLLAGQQTSPDGTRLDNALVLGPPRTTEADPANPADPAGPETDRAYELLRIDRTGVTQRPRVWTPDQARWIAGACAHVPVGATAAPRDRISHEWTGVDATLPPDDVDEPNAHERERDRDGREPPARHAEPQPRERFVDRVAEVARLLHAADQRQATVTEIAATSSGPSLDLTAARTAPAGGEETDSLTRLVDWTAPDGGSLALVLGDFGRGKTFLAHELARMLPERLPHVVPMLVELRHLEKTHGIDELLAAHLAGAGVRRFDRDSLRYMVRHGRIVLLFDGFDELALRVTYERAADHLATLLEALQGRTKLLLTSRSQHFRSDQQVRTALAQRLDLVGGREIIELSDFTDDQIEQFLIRTFDGGKARATERLALIHDIHDLLGLSRNPRMLGFIARLDEARLRHVQAATGSIGSADLYRELLDAWLDHETDRASPAGAAPALSTADRLEAVTALAVRLWQSTERTVGTRELAAAASSVLTTLDAHGLDSEHAAHQVGSGTLLVRTGDDAFTIVHASVMEFLAAAACEPPLRRAGPTVDLLDRRLVSPLMADFVVGLADRDATLRWAGGVLGDANAPAAARRNALTFARRRDPALPRGAGLDRADLTGTDLTGLDLTDACCTATRLLRCNLTAAALDGGDWFQAALLGCTLEPDLPAHPALRFAALTGRDTPSLCTPPHGFVGDVAFSPTNRLVAYTADSTLVLVDAHTGTLLRTLTGHTGPISTVVFSTDGTCTHTHTGHTGGVWSAAFSPTRDVIATASSDSTCRLWDAATGDLIAIMIGLRDGGWAVHRPDGTHTVVGRVAGEFWWSMGLCRFGPGELDAYLPAVQAAQ
ncbi:NACHT domain-containing protein, partial [Candidatus Frankia alpina]|uniref:NACHT domain-containing protein n=1 Tax=Candidatus Frankia alpina TaxID=2699483 RepID=UPI0013D15F3F